ncbi:MAG: hypothetical protein JW918_17455 [Anaerolineae bacterium]|nr:hypothetical protein [Anaerolineae bacterium]
MKQRSEPVEGQWLRPWALVLVLALAYVGLTLVRYGGDPMMFVLVGTQHSQGDPAGSPGYDGQFAYFIARDPAGGCPQPLCDAPSYRYQRILYPLLAWALALGQPEAVPWTLIVVNVVALVGGTYFTERLLDAHRVSRWYALAYGLYGGLVAGLRLDLTEPLAYGLVQAGLWLWMERDARCKMQEAGGKGQGACKRLGFEIWDLRFALFALAALTKETTLVAVVGLLLYLALERRWWEAFKLGLIAGLPFAIWQGVLWIWLKSPGIGAGGDMATPFEAIPFMGLLRVTEDSWPAFWLLLAVEGPLFVLPTIWALVASARDLWRGRRHAWVAILLLQAAVLPFLPYSTWREPLAMPRLAVGLVAATVLYGAQRRSKRVLLFSFFWLATLALLIDESVLPI